MKNTFILIIILVVLVIGALVIFGAKDEAEAPVLEDSGLVDNNQTDIEQDVADFIAETPAIVEPYQSPKTEQDTTENIREFVVKGQNFSFTPSVLTVKKGDRVKITFENSAGFHDFIIDEYDIAAKQAQSPATEILEFTADKAGSFEFYCSVGTHRQMGMKGTLVVE